MQDLEESRMDNPLNAGYFDSEDLKNLGFRRVGDNVKISRNSTVVGFNEIEIGNNVRIDPYVCLIALGGSLRIGSYVHIGSFSHVAARGGVELADFAGLSQGVRIYSATDDYSGEYLTNPTVPKNYTSVRL